jgi:glycosyltransferase involved in cell wall biosynthesis
MRRALLWVSDRVACALAHRVWAVSPSLLEAALAHGLARRSKTMVPARGSINGVDAAEAFRPESHRAAAARLRLRHGATFSPVIGFVGRLVRDKGIVELAAAWGRVRDQHPGTQLWLVGPLDETDPVPAETLAELGADPRVKLLGLDWNIAPYLAAFDLLVLPTRREGLGNVLLEAAAMGIPAVATRTTGCVDAILDGQTGALVPVGDSAALAAAISTYLESPALRALHGAAARQRTLDHFRPEGVWTAIFEGYRAALQDRGLGPSLDERTAGPARQAEPLMAPARRNAHG